jgi:cytochrome c5
VSRPGNRAFLAALPLAAAVLVVAVGAQAQQSDRAERVLNISCGGCHDLRPVETTALDREGWTAVVDDMIGKGADVPDADRTLLLDHLVNNYGPMPAGAGQRVVLEVCTMCHDLGRVKNGRRPRAEWEETLKTMIKEGAPLSDGDFPTVLNYLSLNFAPAK